MLAMFLYACGGGAADAESEAGSANALRADTAPQQTAVKRYGACAGEPGCERSVMLDVLAKNDLKLIKNEYVPQELFTSQETLARDVVRAFLAQPDAPGATRELVIRTEGAAATLFVSIMLFTQDNDGESGWTFRFTLQGDKVEERSVPVDLAG